MNYQKKMEAVINDLEIEQKTPRLLLHSCCAPCSTYVIEYLSQYFEITVFYYNPNISPIKEYELRAAEQRRLITEMKTKYPVTLVIGDYDSNKFFALAKGLELEPECGKRCEKCYELRIKASGEIAKTLGCDYFTTTLTISPMKAAGKLNEIGVRIAKEIQGVMYLESDFKKKGGYKRSTEISREHQLYRQNFCGCIYSKLNMERAQKEKI